MQVADLFASLGLRMNAGQWSAGTAAINRLTTGLQRMIAFGATVMAARWFVGQIEATERLGAHVANLSQSAGVTSSRLQELGYAAEQNGSDIDSMAAGLSKLSRSMLAAKNGGDEQARAFAAMGVRVTDTTGKLRPVEDVLGDIADHFRAMPDGAEKTAQSMSVLGRSGASLIPTLNAGSAGLAAMGREARELGAVLDDRGVESLRDFGRTTDKIKLALVGFRNQAVLALLPTLKRLADGFTSWLKANRAEIVAKLQHAAEWLSRALSMLVDVVGRVVDVGERMIDALERALPGIDLFKTAMVTAGLAMAAAWVAALGPIGLVALAIAAFAIVAQDLYVSITEGHGAFADLWKAIADGHPVIQKIGEELRKLGGIIQDTLKGLKALPGFLHVNERRDAVKGRDEALAEEKELGPQLMENLALQRQLTDSGQTSIKLPGGATVTAADLKAQALDLSHRLDELRKVSDEADAHVKELDAKYADPENQEYHPASIAMRGLYKAGVDTANAGVPPAALAENFMNPWSAYEPGVAGPPSMMTVQAPINIDKVEVRVDNLDNPNDVAASLRGGLSAFLDEHLRNVKNAMQGTKR
jgi:hypothetical protein